MKLNEKHEQVQKVLSNVEEMRRGLKLFKRKIQNWRMVLHRVTPRYFELEKQNAQLKASLDQAKKAQEGRFENLTVDLQAT